MDERGVFEVRGRAVNALQQVGQQALTVLEFRMRVFDQAERAVGLGRLESIILGVGGLLAQPCFLAHQQAANGLQGARLQEKLPLGQYLLGREYFSCCNRRGAGIRFAH